MYACEHLPLPAHENQMSAPGLAIDVGMQRPGHTAIATPSVSHTSLVGMVTGHILLYHSPATYTKGLVIFN